MTIKASNTSRFTNDIASYARNAKAAQATTEVVSNYLAFLDPQTPIATYAVVVANGGYTN